MQPATLSTGRDPMRGPYVGPVVSAVGAMGSVGMLAVVDPNTSGIYPACPSLALFGVLCPFCGGLRGMHALTEGDLVGMVSSNVLLPGVLVLGAWAWLAWTLEVAGRPIVPRPRLGGHTWIVLGVATAVYTILRNLTGTPFEVLAP